MGWLTQQFGAEEQLRMSVLGFRFYSCEARSSSCGFSKLQKRRYGLKTNLRTFKLLKRNLLMLHRCLENAPIGVTGRRLMSS